MRFVRPIAFLFVATTSSVFLAGCGSKSKDEAKPGEQEGITETVKATGVSVDSNANAAKIAKKADVASSSAEKAQ